jgi:4-methyl-5(b-hydroxyethyl)-thiazole monophosphate biosynthesis
MYNKNILVPLAEGFEEVEAVSIIDVLRRANLGVRVCSIEEKEVSGAHSIKILADSVFRDEVIEDYDAIVLPGGTNAAKQFFDYGPLTHALKIFEREGRTIAAICASPALVFAELGLLEHKKATCYPSFKSHLKNYVDEPVVKDGCIITSQGPGTALTFALKLVEVLADAKTATSIRNGILI